MQTQEEKEHKNNQKKKKIWPSKPLEAKVDPSKSKLRNKPTQQKSGHHNIISYMRSESVLRLQSRESSEWESEMSSNESELANHC